MKKLIITLITCFIMMTGYAQLINMRYLKVDRGMETKFKEGAKKKTSIYNSKEGQIRYFTFLVNTGPHSGEYFRVRYEEELSGFDSNDPKGNDYWNDLVGDLHTSSDAQRWGYVKNASHVTVSPFAKPLRRVLTYNYKGTMEKEFWRFRNNVAQALQNADADIFMEVWWCGSGCNGNTVNVVFGHKNYAEQATDNSEEWVKVVEKYNEMFGEDAYEEDIQAFETSLEMYGRSSHSMSFQPEMSSPENMSSLEELNTNN